MAGCFSSAEMFDARSAPSKPAIGAPLASAYPKIVTATANAMKADGGRNFRMARRIFALRNLIMRL
jgi:hypothetical protein